MVPKDGWKIDAQKAAFVTIDMQRGFLDPGAPVECVGARSMVPKINQLSEICRKLKMPVIHVRHSERTDLSNSLLKNDFRPRQVENELEILEGRKGAEFYEGLNIAGGDYVIPKVHYSAFIAGSSSIEPLLRGLGRDSIVICGVATDVCVGMTTADGMMLGFKVFYVGDLTATLSEERHRVALEVLNRHFAKVMTFETVKEELTMELKKSAARSRKRRIPKL